MRQIGWIIVTCILFSCHKNCYRNITDDEANRLGYKGREVIVFKSSSGLFDTLVMDQRVENILDKESKCKDDNYSISVSGRFLNKLASANNVNFYSQITTPESKNKDFLYPEIGTKMGYFPLNKSTSMVSININGLDLFNVYEISNGEHIDDPNVDKIYFSFQHGLLKILNHDGTYWERQNF